MKTVYYLISLTCLFLLCSCTPKIIKTVVSMHDPLPAHQHIRVLTKQDAEPPKAEVLGHITVKNRSASKCKYEVLIETIKQEARQIGGNYIKIIGERKPSAATSCDKIKAIILRAY